MSVPRFVDRYGCSQQRFSFTGFIIGERVCAFTSIGITLNMHCGKMFHARYIGTIYPFIGEHDISVHRI